ncbi:WD domain, G-beta repeat containing protein [Coccidioides posadasii C735 delta SOWgp]|uniref:WD domain, G-beta repeat containing protein n=1 Tax=Coccidioides posadasii (strain C735) TaxID=222929 RepID=C5PDX6_COCP7|nr:rRNA processing protein RRP9 [Coccidioides posadasii C735 delta SOWgp]EER25287.1 WD domain, G-beta repeat containing protein [Coccidioides posadasii C735 delta SOWgp]|eukprot:XP_003067432.1 rRNA processing protein RRP9 [Coccidioides posadasii C735 delta SOWgp]
MPSFFTIPASQRKRKREDQAAAPASKKRGLAGKGRVPSAESRQKRQEREESISGSESDDDEGIESGEESIDEEELSGSEEEETAAERRLRLAERYLENIKEEVDEAGFDAAEIDRDLIAERLKEDVDESKGRTYRQIASQLSFSTASHSYFRADTQSTTSVAVHSPYVYTVSKDKTLIKWELIPPVDIPDTDVTTTKRPARPLRKKPKKIRSIKGLQAGGNDEEPQGHTGNILAVAVSPSGKFVATGGADKKLIIWDADTLTPLKTFTQHRDSVSGLSFTRRISAATTGEQLFSSSFDRTLKTWSLSPGSHAYVETLFGHQDHVISVASMVTDQCVSVGARDRTARLWKVVDETQLVFRGGGSKGSEYAENSIDCVAVIPPAHFVTGSDDGSISLWSMHKKKPLFTIRQAHGLDPIPGPEEISPDQDPDAAARSTKYMRPTPRWITALATLPGTDIVLSGSWDGWIRAWQVSEDKRKIVPLGCVGGQGSPAHFLNDQLEFNPARQINGAGVNANASSNEPPLNGIVNDIAVFERRPQDSKTSSAMKVTSANNGSKAFPMQESTRPGLCIVAALGKEHRLGRWKVFGSNDRKKIGASNSGGRNGAVVFEVPFYPNASVIES